jgi:hypothetical protein
MKYLKNRNSEKYAYVKKENMRTDDREQEKEETEGT